MRSRQLVCGALAVAALLGCNSQPPAATTAPAPQAASANRSPARPTPEALRNRTEAAARDLETVLVRRGKTSASDVNWSDPSRTRSDARGDDRPDAQSDRVSEGENDAGVAAGTSLTDAARPASDKIEHPRAPETAPTTRLVASLPPGAAVPAPVAPAISPTTVPASDAMGARFAQQIKDNPRDVAAHLNYQLLQFLRDQQVPELASMSALPAEDREILTAFLDGVSNLRNTLRADNNILLSQKVRPVLELADRLRSQAELTIPTVAVCSKVHGFGVYDPMDGKFTAGRDNPVVLYCEVENFATLPNADKMWETKLSQQAVLYTETGMPVMEDKMQTITDTSRNRRHDFYSLVKMKFPPNVPIGRYLLKVTVTDLQAKRVAEATLPIVFDAQDRPAVGRAK